METMDDERMILKLYRTLKYDDIAFIGNYFRCLRIEFLTKCPLFYKTWIDSSSKDSPPPDFHNDRHKIMMEIMRVDDCVNEKNGKFVQNSFARASILRKRTFSKEFNERNDLTLFITPDTSNNNDFSYDGYCNNFRKVFLNHSNKVEKYKENYPQCKTRVLFICDESNSFVQLTDETQFNGAVPFGKIKIHSHYLDNYFLKLIKSTNADYVIWYSHYKSLYINGKKIKTPRACIYDVKHIKRQGIDYNPDMMYRVTEEIK